MVATIAVAGKGGVGKTSFCALLARWLTGRGDGPILMVDADPNSNLSEALGVGVKGYLSEILARTKEIGGIPTGMSQDEFISYRMHGLLTEGDEFDLLAMGGPEGPGCYCFPNNVLRKHLRRLSMNYHTVIMDNEAGLEHISRGTTVENVDELFILSDTSVRSVRSAARIAALTRELRTPIINTRLILTRGGDGDIKALEGEIAKIGLPGSGMIPEDRSITEYELAGGAIYDMPADAPCVAAVNAILDRVLGGAG